MSAGGSRTAAGLVLALVSTLAFAVSGAFVAPLLETGWTPAAAVTARVLVAGLALAIPAAVALRGRWRRLARAWRRVLAFGLVPIALTQLAYFAAIDRIPIGTALLIEYLAPVLLVALAWVRTRRRPALVVLAGSVAAIGGLALVIGPGGGALDLLGLAFAGVAAVGLAAYFLLGAMPDGGVPPVALAASGLLLGGLVLALLGAVGILPLAWHLGEVTLLGAQVSFLVPLLVVALIGTSLAYASGIAATARLGSRLASFVGLLEVVFAVVVAWLLLGQVLAPLQLAGGALILVGIALVRAERPGPVELEPATADTLGRRTRS
ncbi:EamA family transporter [Homoserinibacter sp. YIM 151385]|uniref:EamA family transporter n=1 Tax=Homoserinibacter sp. YIM 151385 TaxID=2985506 RepID=UPI0022EFE10E|nr:DMT family transporter [Homoserinibacter sp. YIM 151385]WBU38044.1 DMT family transporter [Homoserinibacter sp. YIM 151385]